ncbi:MAG: flagellar basal body protein, partial [Rhodospirillales bacterium]
MGDITQALRAAQSGLLANQTALNIVSQNVANVNTVGYSRKIIQQQSVVLAGQGAGVSIADFTRVV